MNVNSGERYYIILLVAGHCICVIYCAENIIYNKIMDEIVGWHGGAVSRCGRASLKFQTGGVHRRALWCCSSCTVPSFSFTHFNTNLLDYCLKFWKVHGNINLMWWQADMMILAILLENFYYIIIFWLCRKYLLFCFTYYFVLLVPRARYNYHVP